MEVGVDESVGVAEAEVAATCGVEVCVAGSLREGEAVETEAVSIGDGTVRPALEQAFNIKLRAVTPKTASNRCKNSRRVSFEVNF
jgi:hypothetical protein